MTASEPLIYQYSTREADRRIADALARDIEVDAVETDPRLTARGQHGEP
jgi:hypothetical protein